MRTILDVLEAVRLRPEMYVGLDPSQRGGQLQNIELILHGYAMAAENHSLKEPVSDFPREFGKYLHRKFGWSVECGPVAAIRAVAADDSDAWELFWKLVGEFKATLPATGR